MATVSWLAGVEKRVAAAVALKLPSLCSRLHVGLPVGVSVVPVSVVLDDGFTLYTVAPFCTIARPPGGAAMPTAGTGTEATWMSTEVVAERAPDVKRTANVSVLPAKACSCAAGMVPLGPVSSAAKDEQSPVLAIHVHR